MSGFHNVCSHRSNRLVVDERGSCRGALFCRFHNWAYSDRDELVRVPDEEKFIGLDKRDHGLTPVDIDIWRGFIFVHLAPDPAETLRDYLGGVADRLDGCPFDEMKLSQVYTVEEHANWKVVLDAQNEVYHLPHKHRWTLGDAFAKDDTGNCRFKEVILYDHHSFWSVDYRSFQDLTPLKIALFIGDDDAGAFKVPNMIGELDHYLLFPNGIIMLFNVGRWPLRPRKTKRSPARRSRPRSCCTCRASVFMPRRMSVTPVASHTRAPLGTGIIASPKPRSPAPAPRSRRTGR